MDHYKYIILGSGPSGLAFAHTLLERGQKDFLVLEKETDAGGLCRSVMVDGSPLDIGGGHFLDTRIPRAFNFLFRFLPDNEWNHFERRSSIDFGSHSIDYPIESNIWQLPLNLQIDYLEAVAKSGENIGQPAPEHFEDWIRWKLGTRIAEDYMLPYNQKLWSVDLSTLGTYWMEKLPSVSFRETLLSCLTHRPEGKLPAHRTFLYPASYGYGEVWQRMGHALGEKLICNMEINSLDIRTRVVNNCLSADIIIQTIPWNAISLPGLPKDIVRAVNTLKHTGIQIDYCSETLADDHHWIYIPDLEIPYHRILNRSRFATGSRGYWTEANIARRDATETTVSVNQHAYPLNTREKPSAIKAVTEYAKLFNVFGLGRWGTWEHINSDFAVDRAIELATQLLSKQGA